MSHVESQSVSLWKIDCLPQGTSHSTIPTILAWMIVSVCLSLRCYQLNSIDCWQMSSTPSVIPSKLRRPNRSMGAAHLKHNPTSRSHLSLALFPLSAHCLRCHRVSPPEADEMVIFQHTGSGFLAFASVQLRFGL